VTATGAVGMQTAVAKDATSLPGTTVTTQHFCGLNGAAVNCATGGAGTTYYVQVKVTGTYTPLITYPGIPSGITITSTAVMRVAGQ
jgi:hypothetical protein